MQRKKKKKKVEHHPEARGLFYVAISFIIFLCLMSYVDGHHEENWLGLVGHFIAFSLHYAFGLASYLFVGFLIWMGWRLVKIRNYQSVAVKSIYFSVLLISTCFLLNVLAETKWIDFSFLEHKVYSETAVIQAPLPMRYIRYNLGGVPFYYLYRDLPGFNLQSMLSDVGILVIFSCMALVSFIILTDLSFFRAVRRCSNLLPKASDVVVELIQKVIRASRRVLWQTGSRADNSYHSGMHSSGTRTFSPAYEANDAKKRSRQAKSAKNSSYQKPSEPNTDFPARAEISIAQLPMKPPTEKNIRINDLFSKKDTKKYAGSDNYEPPPLTLLTDAKQVDQTGLKKELNKRAAILEETLMSFGIEAKVGHIHCGPTITSFEVHPAIGVKVQKIKALENDIALNLQAKSIRIIAPIPGKAAVGVEIPSLNPQEVGFKEMLSTYRRVPSKYTIPILLGKTVRGEDVMCDLTKMPHCIIAGATGSGKSVCINTIIMSILMNAGPDTVRLVLVDPKKVELTFFANLPHLIAPVITEAAGAYAALQWLVKEMQYRYELFKRLSVRNINSFNNRKRDVEFEESLEMEVPEKLHFIVAIIDEFADLMMTSSADLETPIARIAQMARAVGIHLILATQRPSREVITGLIKANFPTRMSFKVSSRVNSQIILDENGAETLLGNGDMLFLPPGSSELIRCQGVYVRDEDIKRVVDYLCSKIPTHYLLKSFDQYAAEEISEKNDATSDDPLYEKALDLVLSYRTASTTFLQRKLKIGYARAASLMDMLEENRIIGPQEGAKPRKILKDQVDDLYDES